MLVIGERINASNKSVGQAIASRDREFIENLARRQDAAGADFIDVNAGAGEGSWARPETAMEWLVEVIQSASEKPLTIDSDTPAVIEAGLRKCRSGTVMINSVNAEPKRLETIGAMAADRQASLIALAMGEGGIPDNVEERLAACDLIVNHLARLGIEEEHIFFDPLVLPISVDTTQALVTLRTIATIKSRYASVNTTMGLSNISFGLPRRDMVNRAFLLMAISAGLDSAILDPLDAKLMSYAKIGTMLAGKDPSCKGYIRAHRKGTLVD